MPALRAAPVARVELLEERRQVGHDVLHVDFYPVHQRPALRAVPLESVVHVARADFLHHQTDGAWFGPLRRVPKRPRIGPGAALATVLWLVASEALSFYVSRMSSFGATYGSLAAIVGVMLWFYVSAYAVLLGAELNARLEEADDGQQPGSQQPGGQQAGGQQRAD